MSNECKVSCSMKQWLAPDRVWTHALLAIIRLLVRRVNHSAMLPLSWVFDSSETSTESTLTNENPEIRGWTQKNIFITSRSSSLLCESNLAFDIFMLKSLKNNYHVQSMKRGVHGWGLWLYLPLTAVGSNLDRHFWFFYIWGSYQASLRNFGDSSQVPVSAIIIIMQLINYAKGHLRSSSNNEAGM
jgi:hypothetical protein